MNLEINKETAKKLHSEVPAWFQKKLEEKFGVETFKKRDYTDIKTFEDACNEVGVDPLKVTSQDDTIDEAAYKKLKIIVAAINGGWVPDWTNSAQYKYFPWFRLSSGSGLSAHVSGYDSSGSSVGSRLCYESKEKCLYAMEQFKSIYEIFSS
jgi:hypothetical protein